MEPDQWHDPLLITDVSWQQELNSHSHYPSITSPSSQTSIMEDPDDIHLNANNDVSWQNRSLESNNSEKFGDLTPNNAFDGRSMLGFSLTSPDLVICAGSPDNPRSSYEVSPRFLMGASIELSLENGINGPKLDCKQELPTDEEFLDASLELLPVPMIEDKVSPKSIPVVSINSGSLDGATTLDGTDFLEDSFFTGGDVIRTATKIGDGQAIGLYQTARFGNFSYRFKTIERGIYVVDLHLAEIVFTDGPPGMRVFDVYIQEQKAVSCIDIYACVGANKPLVIPDLKTFVSGGGGLSIRLEGVTGNPLVCGISVRKDLSASFGEVELLKTIEMSRIPECEISEDSGNCEAEGEFQNLRVEYERQREELTNTRRVLEELKSENESKSRECQEARRSLKELQNELMRKSMHVGSLAFAIEGQVKEKGKWFSSLRHLKRKLKLLKMDQVKLSEEALSYKKCLVDMNDMSSIIQSKFDQQVELHEDLKLKFIKGAKERKEFYNKILELKGNIRVFCRCRPLNTEETVEGASMAIDFEAARDGELTVKSNGRPKKTFKYDAVFGPQSNQVDVFEDTAPFATSVLDGYNVCIFAYGQTGTGKTFTMEGTNEARGVNFRTLEELFHIIGERKGQFQYEISVSVLEVYNEQIRDLLVLGTQPGAAKRQMCLLEARATTSSRLEIRQVGEGIHHVPGLVEAHVNNMNEVWEVLQTGSNARAVGSTNANEHSSRSHCIHCVMVKGENLLNGECTRSKLWLVDLAGSERVAKTEVQGERLKETQNINRSLSALGDVISALATKSPHIPFRNSKLTHLLQDSLGGDSKTLMFVQISPNENDLSETLCSLNFASRVRGIELGPTKKQVESTELLKYKQLIKELESQLLLERRLVRQHVDSKLAEQQQQQQQMRQQQQEEQNSAFSRPPLPSRPLQKNFNEGKELVLNHTRPFSELNSYKLPSLDSIVKHSDPMEKENNPEMAEPPLGAKQSGRASLCPILQRIPEATAPRRNSLIPLPSAPGLAKFPQPLLPLPPIQDDKKEERDGVECKRCFEPVPWDSPKEHKSGGGKNTKVSSILRRSLQRRVQIRSPMQQHMRRGAINVGMEKVRFSIGSRGRVAHRVLLGNTRRPIKDGQQKESQREKERGWNIGTAGRII
ncbi:di-glucose binding protein with Kinesin motor domain-containing protein [Actinidia rufa]|uniref:Di-glucose binding protein with Kinesin motor domain-containing protein n=1 Tax=Actinidia rufa TaxID=165716 RepID=A0A7J0G2Z9_9ERIC|nr:di-glucose binding protein with Kinesin motor domain-containing protein [Actinidia rufa]